MKITIKCFSQVKYALGIDEFVLELEAGTMTSELEQNIRSKADGKLDGISLRIAVNQKYIPNDIELNDGDEVAFIPPVQGG
ncbi:MAG: MoaD/ThiS family protein [Candidatus Marinimicrobia bacterium]|jgi:molybdopterin synthase sulfur carrier subunit|nr:MoaD/ThiS family protein [Candidatus Neomarinimicrobiota bacterium]MBT3947650.1 MoaD/ThiS family protein [Candidatus Neomarinimicrobiota bacterium]MBT4064732.1 MoaD/ThiS family protein [Candidatus Neomarinimicrobiota bacterium]MBT4308067.1 MoaD/ThiS family protein [Candidatus Neomarinimicrobiota bacterium]MBT4452439.1 MoaD/ThiS family protein [Candidatus Neomarinimicrobiota bacterium]|tara:strand:- start:1304 stop:1546 length:243 start_codon:yes stop_codon:yes gene_type:complete